MEIAVSPIVIYQTLSYVYQAVSSLPPLARRGENKKMMPRYANLGHGQGRRRRRRWSANGGHPRLILGRDDVKWDVIMKEVIFLSLCHTDADEEFWQYG
jgi:hypothetical protein